MREEKHTILFEFWRVVLVFIFIFITLAILSYSVLDPGLNQHGANFDQVNNLGGVVGAYISSIFVDLLGIVSFGIPIFGLYLGISRIFKNLQISIWRHLGVAILFLSVLLSAGNDANGNFWKFGDIKGGGFFGSVGASFIEQYFHTYGSVLIKLFLFLLGLQLTFNFSWVAMQNWFMKRLNIGWDSYQSNKAIRVEHKKNIRETKYKVNSAVDEDLLLRSQVNPVESEDNENLSKDEKLVINSSVSDESVIGNKRDAYLSGNNGTEVEVLQEQANAVLEDKKISIEFDNDAIFDTNENFSDKKNLKYSLQFLFEDDLQEEIHSVTKENESGFNPSTNTKNDLNIVNNVKKIEEFPPFSKTKINTIKDKNHLDKGSTFSLPNISFLTKHNINKSETDKSNAIFEEQARRLSSCLDSFGIKGIIEHIIPGPVVTMFEFKPAPGVKVSRIANLNDDLALALKASAVRIIAPLPQKDTVGIEVPNIERQNVYLRDIVESQKFSTTQQVLPLALGQDIGGHAVVVDLSKMPHLLVAGATGAGKSVCLNCLLLSLLYKYDPSKLKLLLIDPKRIELAVYSDIPHLVHPVVTDMKLAKSALDWAVLEMDRRYDAMAYMKNVRNIADYNKKLKTLHNAKDSEFATIELMPHLVIVVDELADLMMTSAKEIEGQIVRLAQLARAAGIHLIIATQRPSVDVVTGIIKANFPSRIAFQVSSKHDSRTILDTAGAEYLLGQGDMLFKRSGGIMQRIHGAFVSDNEIESVTNFWKNQMSPNYEIDFAQLSQNVEESFANNVNEMLDTDPKYIEAVAFVKIQGKASISLIQRRFRIGFNKAAGYIEKMEADGLLGPQEGSKPRQVLH